MISMILSFALSADTALPTAAPLAQPEFGDKAILQAIDATFASLESGDGEALLKLVYPEGRVTARGAKPDGAAFMRTQTFAEYAAKMKLGSGFIERISNPVIEQDADVAMVWAPFTITVGGKVVSCGYDHFDLIRENGAWKILNITFSTRTTECPGQ